MNVQILTRAKVVPVIARKVIFDTSSGSRLENMTLCFECEADSYNAFSKLREIGIRCYHTGGNAVGGPAVMIYSCDKNNFQLLIQE